MDVLDSLNISDEERATLRSLGAKTPRALLSLRKASLQAFDAQFRPGRAEAIASELRQYLTYSELEELNQPPGRPGPLGARPLRK